MGRDKAKDEEISDLAEPGGKVRLFVEGGLSAGAKIVLAPQQSHYLLHVMRARPGDGLLLFNGNDGEWRARVEAAGKRGCILAVEARTEFQAEVPDLWLAFAPVKKTPADYLVQKATELGVRVLQPVLTHRTIVRRVNLERLRANAIEASEQSGRLCVPEIREALSLAALLESWPQDRRLIFCDEAGDAPPIAATLNSAARECVAWGVLTGPEGGFDKDERALIRRQPYVVPVTLGPRILRADTAALAALSIWQAIAGDWSNS